MKKHLFLPVIALMVLTQCKSSKSIQTRTAIRASIIREGLLNCFEKGLSTNGQPAWCEASAILYDGKKIFVANDKDMPDKRSSVFYYPAVDGFPDTTHPPAYLDLPVFKNVKKFEDFALTPDGKWVFLTTGFDRVKPGSTEWNSYNAIVYWPAGSENKAKVLTPGNTDSNSVFLRDKISQALKSPDFPGGMPYFKIEGLAATNDKLYLGVREEGKKFDDFKYKIKILTINYRINNEIVQLINDFTVLTDFNVSSVEPSIKESIAISSIEYDRFNKHFLILTSFENGEKLGGYLWVASGKDLENNRMQLVRNDQGNPLSFSNKAEDLAVLSSRRILIIHDDDRVMTTVAARVRQANEAGYSVVEFK